MQVMNDKLLVRHLKKRTVEHQMLAANNTVDRQLISFIAQDNLFTQRLRCGKPYRIHSQGQTFIGYDFTLKA